jgi:uncharacterized cupin superfamily protein
MHPVLIPGLPLNANDLVLEHLPVPADQVAEGKPTTGLHRLGLIGGLSLGVWEMSIGGMHDTECEEVFLVISGRATVEFHHDDGLEPASRKVPLVPGSLMRLAAGMRTTWTVDETLRKLYFTPMSVHSEAV